MAAVWHDLRWWALGGAVVGAAAGGVVALRRARRRTPEEMERLRRLRIDDIGRLASGEIIDLMPAPQAEQPPTVVYEYDVNGVTYQVSQALHEVPISFNPESWTPGLPVQVKFDPANPGNSILACERWNGLMARRKKAAAPAEAPAGDAPAEAATKPEVVI